MISYVFTSLYRSPNTSLSRISTRKPIFDRPARRKLLNVKSSTDLLYHFYWKIHCIRWRFYRNKMCNNVEERTLASTSWIFIASWPSFILPRCFIVLFLAMGSSWICTCESATQGSLHSIPMLFTMYYNASFLLRDDDGHTIMDFDDNQARRFPKDEEFSMLVRRWSSFEPIRPVLLDSICDCVVFSLLNALTEAFTLSRLS